MHNSARFVSFPAVPDPIRSVGNGRKTGLQRLYPRHGFSHAFLVYVQCGRPLTGFPLPCCNLFIVPMSPSSPGFRSLLVENTLDLLSDLRDRTRFTSAIAVLTQDDERGLVLASLPGMSDHGYVPRVGFRFHLHSTAPGKALLAFLPPATRLRIVKSLDLKRFTERTICTEQALLDHLEECAAERVIFDKSEYVMGVNCVASCLLGGNGAPLAAVWVTSLAMDLPEEELPAVGKIVLGSVKEMQLRLQNAVNASYLHHDYEMERAKQFIEEHFHDEAAVRRFHETIGMSESWFRRLFRDKHGIAPMSYRLQLLHERARRLLLNTNLSNKEIAFQLGYESQNYFSRAFKKAEGLSPAHYRQKMRRSGTPSGRSA